MPITFYPHEDDLMTSSIEEKLEVLTDAAERYKAAVLEVVVKAGEDDISKPAVPKDNLFAFNWEEIAKTLSEIRHLPETTQNNKLSKADKLKKLAEIYEILRGAKMPKLEAVRIALVNEANQLRGG